MEIKFKVSEIIIHPEHLKVKSWEMCELLEAMEIAYEISDCYPYYIKIVNVRDSKKQVLCELIQKNTTSIILDLPE